MKALILILALCVSCSPQKRLNRLIKKNPQLVIMDTLHHRDTIQHITERVQTDTVLSLQSITHDTTIITRENLTIKTFYRNDSIFISGECQEDTLFIPYEVAIPYEKIIVTQKQGAANYIIIIIGVLILVFLFKYLRK